MPHSFSRSGLEEIEEGVPKQKLAECCGNRSGRIARMTSGRGMHTTCPRKTSPYGVLPHRRHRESCREEIPSCSDEMCTCGQVDVEKPASEEMVKRTMPMWIQERLHHRWLDNIILRAQPQGADNLQRDVDASLRRTRTQALLNCSFGRDWDEQHCWFANFVLEPKIALECDSMLPMGPGKPRPNGFLQLKSRILRKIGYTVVTIHNCFWKRLTEDQKDEQILRMRTSVSYVHNKELDKANRPLRQEPHKYDGMERKVSDWNPIAAPASQ